MKKSVPKRPRGRPRTGIQPALSARVPEEVFERVAQWAEANNCTRSIAVAKLIELGLDAIQRPAAKSRKPRQK
jgi:hypothetical protein